MPNALTHMQGFEDSVGSMGARNSLFTGDFFRRLGEDARRLAHQNFEGLGGEVELFDEVKEQQQ